MLLALVAPDAGDFVALAGVQSSLAPDGSLTLSSAELSHVPRNELISAPDSVERQEQWR